VSANFTTNALIAIGMEPSMSPSVRLVMLAAERADREGLATFDEGELRDLFADESGKRADSKTIWSLLHVAMKTGLVLPDPTAEEIRLDTSLVQPEGSAEVGARYGELTLMPRVEGSGDKWLCRCTCKRVRTYKLDYLAAGITKSCGQHRPA